ncbi:MAG: hypothetical protein AAF682_24925 [Planctomycetota bacterium]
MKTQSILRPQTALFAAALVAAPVAWSAASLLLPNLIIGQDNNSGENTFLQPEDPALSGGGRDQTLKFGDMLFGTNSDDVIQGRLGTDVIVGSEGNDVLIGGTEHFNSENRDRAFGGPGYDAFLWSPGDGSDFFDGGEDLDVVVLGLMGELDDQGQLFFGVTNDEAAGDVVFDPATGLPSMDLVNSPGFCEVVDPSSSADAATELADLGLDRLVKFFIRGVADSFAAGEQTEDNGLRVTLHLKDVEFLVCTSREGGVVEAFDLRTTPPTQIRPSRVPVPAIADILK